MSAHEKCGVSASNNGLRHVAIIMDGNGRWAKECGKQRIFGHQKGAEKVSEIMSEARDMGIEYLTLFAFSSENWNRPKDEVSALMELLSNTISANSKKFVENNTRFLTIGDISALPQYCREKIDTLKKGTAEFTKHNLVLALNYGSRDEIVRSVKKIAADCAEGKLNPQNIDWGTVEQNLDTAKIPDPDLLIRTSGELRLSNFLMLQAAYSELYFSPNYWPDFSREEFSRAVCDYLKRERRYGLTGEQLK